VSLHLKTTKDIAAAPERVWEVLSDLDAYSEWNPFILSAAGRLTEGARLEIRVQPQEGRATRFRPTVQAVAPNRELRWLGHLGVRGLFDGEHRFAIEPTATGSRLTH
jgi:hypothetical protein